MIKEIIDLQDEFQLLFPNLSDIEFTRFLNYTLKPYFNIINNGKETLSFVLEMLYEDMKPHNKDNSKTFLIPRNGKFKSSVCEKYGLDIKINRKYDLTVADFINPHNNYDLIFASHYRTIYFNDTQFQLFYNFVINNYDFLKNYDLYLNKSISLKSLRNFK